MFGCSCCSVLLASLLATLCGGVEVSGVAPVTLILGAAVASAFFCATAEFLRELAADGGGDFSRGDSGHCGVVSPEPAALLCCLGSFDTASDMEPCCSCGTAAADKALWIAAAEGCVDIGVVRGPGLLSLRIGEVFREVRGLVPAGDAVCGIRLPEGVFRSCGICVDDADACCGLCDPGLRR